MPIIKFLIRLRWHCSDPTVGATDDPRMIHSEYYDTWTPVSLSYVHTYMPTYMYNAPPLFLHAARVERMKLLGVAGWWCRRGRSRTNGQQVFGGGLGEAGDVDVLPQEEVLHRGYHQRCRYCKAGGFITDVA